jgi:glutaminyl-peptide cyclotransferase
MAVRFHRVEVVRRVPHPGRGFTQGLIVRDGMVWESAGLYGSSALTRYPLGADRHEGRAELPMTLFAEGICLSDGYIWQLTWQERVALRWDPATLAVVGTVPYNRDGWGICNPGEHLLTSDGTSELVTRDRVSLDPLGVTRVRLDGRRLDGLNDLDWAEGRVWANILDRPCLVGIDPASGEVTDIVDARPVMERLHHGSQAVLNGVAWLGEPGEFLLTGKEWRNMYHVRLAAAPARSRTARLVIG